MAGLLTGLTDTLGLTDSTAGLGDLKASRKMTADIIAMLKDVDVPDIEKQKILLENPELVGLLQAEELGDSAMEDISLDPKMREAQLAALQSFQEEGEQGFTQEDRSAQNILRRDADSRANAEQEAILSGMAQRGSLDSGAQLAAQLGAQQGSSQRRAEGADRLAMDAASRRRNAMTQSANMAAGMEGADFSRQSQAAQAKDSISQFNAANRQNVAAQNLAARQNIENQRASNANQTQVHNKGLLQQDYQNKMGKAGTMATAMGGQASSMAQQGAAKQQGAAGQLGSLLNVGSTLGAAAIKYSDERTKDNIVAAPNELQEMLDKLNAVRYNYKPEMGLGNDDKYGVIAQDLEKSEVGKRYVVEDEEGMKSINYGDMGETQLAALADIHQRVKNLEKKV